MDLFIIFLTGLTTGGLSCLAMQGGLLAGVIANQKDQELTLNHKTQPLTQLDKLDWQPVTMFLIAKLITHTILGFLLGMLGSVISLSVGVRLFFQAFTALFMFATAMNLLNVHPIFRYVAFQPPKFLQRIVRNSSKRTDLFAPAILGAFTIFVPCGVTQAMEVLAINTGNPLQGALIMFSFILGTSPLFALIGVATAKLSERWYHTFTQFAAIILFFMAIYGLNGVLVVLDAPITFQKLINPPTTSAPTVNSYQPAPGEVQAVTIQVHNSGYSPNRITVTKNAPVELTLVSNNTYSCALAFVFPAFNINTFLESTDQQTFSFTPTQPGKYTFSCSMGMYTGELEVI